MTANDITRIMKDYRELLKKVLYGEPDRIERIELDKKLTEVEAILYRIKRADENGNLKSHS